MNSNSIIPVTIEYDEVVKTWNAGSIAITSFLLLLFWFVLRRRRKHQPKINKKQAIETTQSEIEALEQARAVMFAKEAARIAREEATKAARKKKQSENTETKPKRVVKKVAPPKE